MKTETYDVNGVQIRQRKLPKLYQNRDLLLYSRENRKKFNLAEIVFWKQVHKGRFGEDGACGAANLAIASLYCRSTVGALSEHCRSRPTEPLGSSEESARQDRS